MALGSVENIMTKVKKTLESPVLPSNVYPDRKSNATMIKIEGTVPE